MEYTDSYRAFCERLKISRKLLGYDQVRMASDLDMTRDEYANKESGRTMITGTDLKKIYNTVNFTIFYPRICEILTISICLWTIALLLCILVLYLFIN